MDNFFTSPDATLRFFTTLGIVFTGGVAAFFIIKTQVKNSLQDTVKVLQDELNVYKGRTDRLTDDLSLIKKQYDDVKMKKNYLKQLVLEALQNQTNLQKLIGESLLNGKKDSSG